MSSENDKQPELQAVPQTCINLVEKTIQKEMELCRKAQQEIAVRVVNKLDAMIRSHALHTSDRILESYLRKMEDSSYSKVRWIIAKFVSKKLNKAFEDDKPDVLKLEDIGYVDHANLFTQLIHEAKNVYLTCVYHPAAWFENLKDVSREPYTCIESGRIWCESCHNKLYPPHFITFLDNPHNGERVRVFLLDPSNWNGLMNEDNYEDFLKFIGPCKEHHIETFFVNLQIATEQKGDLYGMRKKLKKPEDYNVFDNQVVITYRERTRKVNQMLKLVDEPPSIRKKGTLELRMGNISAYTDLFQTVKKRLGEGIYTDDEILNKLSNGQGGSKK